MKSDREKEEWCERTLLTAWPFVSPKISASSARKILACSRAGIPAEARAANSAPQCYVLCEESSGRAEATCGWCFTGFR